jgi:alpha-tubulin suppressor-like RCC1 family protein
LAVAAVAAVASVSVSVGGASPASASPASASPLTTALAWGRNDLGQLGNGTAANSSTPMPVSLPAGTRVTAVSAGFGHNLALTSTGRVLAWGDNTFGQVGDGTTTNRSTPVPVSLPPGTWVTAIAGGGNHSLALTSTGRVLAWGLNDFGQVGDGTTTNRSTPVLVSLPAGMRVTAISGGGDHSLAIR